MYWGVGVEETIYTSRVVARFGRAGAACLNKRE